MDIYLNTLRLGSDMMLITLYCVRYDPYYCSVDPERIWTIIQDCGGCIHAGPVGSMDFYVPERLISVVMLLDPGLRLRLEHSYV